MNTLDSLRTKATEAAEAFARAEAKAAEEANAIRGRNLERRAAFWSDASDRCAAARLAVRTARQQVVSAAAAGDLVAAVAAYGDYARRVVEADVVIRQARAATGVYVFPEARQLDPTDRASMSGGRLHRPATETVERRVPVAEWDAANVMPPSQCRIEYPANVNGEPERREQLAPLLSEGLDQLTNAHQAAFTADLLAPLHAQLEPDPEVP